MTNTDNESPITISTSTLAIDTLVASFDSDTSFKQLLSDADVLIVPTDLSPEYSGPVFPVATSTLFRYLRECLNGHGIVEAAIRDDDYREFEYRSDDIILPVLFVAREVLHPLVVSILGSYLRDLLGGRGSNQPASRVKSEFHFKAKNGVQLSLKYDGPADKYEQLTLQKLSELGLLGEKETQTDEDERKNSS